MSDSYGGDKKKQERYHDIESQVAKPQHRQREYGTTNKEFAETNVEFKAACDIAGVKPTKRQASRFRNNRGKAFSAKKNQ